MPQPTPNPAEIRSALDRVAASPGFADAGRLPLFLRFLVERALDGDAAQLKESVLGVEVFQRPADYDPRVDPIVRVEARRLRSRLDEYYGSHGKDDPVRIQLPKGGYVPVFESAAAHSKEDALPRGRKLAWWIAGLAAAGILLGVGQAVYMRKARQTPSPAVAVMPFANVGGDPENEYFSEGLTEEIGDRLARIPGLKVVSRSLTAQYRGQNADLRDVGRRFGASVVVEGSVRREGERLRVTARLSSAADGSSLWSQTYERQTAHVFAIQDEIAHSIAGALRVQVRAGPGAAQVPKRYTANLDAYNSYLKARYQLNLFSVEGMKRAVGYCEEALRTQPDYAPSMALLSQVYALLGYYNGIPLQEGAAKARIWAERAIKIDDGLAEAHAALGMVQCMAEWKWQEAEASFKRALERDPASPVAHGLYGLSVLGVQGRLKEAQREFRVALEQDPLEPFLNFTAAFGLLADGRVDEAIAQYQRTIELKNLHQDVYWDYGMALGYAGRHKEAAEAYRKSRQMRGADPNELFGLEAYFSGDVEKARRDLPRLEEHVKAGKSSWMDLARLSAMLGERGKALDALERALDHREVQAIWIKVDPRLKNLRREPRYRELLAKVGLDGEP